MKKTIIILFITVGLITLATSISRADVQADLKFVEKLAENGYILMADDFYATITGVPDNLKTQARLTRIRIKKYGINFSRTPKERKERLDTTIKLIETFIKNSPNQDDDAVTDAKFEIGELLQDKGRFLVAWMKNETDAEVKEKLKKETQAVYSQAADYFKVMIKVYKKRINKIPWGTKDKKLAAERKRLENNLVGASRSHPVTLYFNALLYDKNNKEREVLLKEGIKLFRSFLLKYGQMIISFDVADFCGLCYYELGDYKKAQIYFKIASHKLIEKIKKESRTTQERQGWLMDYQSTIQKGFYHLAMTANANQEFNQAIQSAEETLKWYPDSKNESLTQLALMEKATAYANLGRGSEAIALVQEIIKSNGPAKRKAKDKQDEFSRMGIAIPPDIRLNTIRDAFDRGNYDEVVRHGQRLMAALEKAPRKIKETYLPEALWLMGNACRWRNYGTLDGEPLYRLYEAAMFYETLEQKFREVKDQNDKLWAPRAVKMAAETYLIMGHQLKGKNKEENADTEKYRYLIKYLNKNWPESEATREIKYPIATEHKIKKEYLLAAKLFGEVPESSPKYLNSRFHVGYMYFQAAKKQWNNYLTAKNKTKKNQLKKEAKKAYHQADININNFVKKFESDPKATDFIMYSKTYLARIYLHEEIKKYRRVFTVLKGMETKYDGRHQIITQVFRSKIKAAVWMNDLDKAEVYLKSLLDYSEKNTLDPPTSSIQLIVLGYEAITNKIIPPDVPSEDRPAKIAELKVKNPKKHEKFTQAQEKLANFLLTWIEQGAFLNESTALSIGDTIYMAASELNREKFFREAVSIYKGLLTNKFKKDNVPLSQPAWKISYKLVKCYVKLNDWDSALNHILRLKEERPNDGLIKTLAATAYEKIAEKPGQEGYLTSALREWSELVISLPKNEQGEYLEEWWNARYHIIEIYYKQGEYAKALKKIEDMRMTISPELDKDKYGFKTKFKKLEKQIKEILPR